MLKSIVFLVPMAGLSCLAVGVLRDSAADPPAKGLEFVRLELADGMRWVLGDGAVGRPFLARLVLANNGMQPINIWDPDGSEGASCPQVILTDEKGNETVLRPGPIPRFAGIPTARSLAPAQVCNIDLELLRLVDVDSPPPPGEYAIRAIYASEAPKNPFVKDIWTGKIQSDRLPMKIVLPHAPRAGR